MTHWLSSTLFADVRSDFRAVGRSILREKTPFLACVLTLAIGLGANAAVLTALRASLAPVPFPGPEALLHVGGTSERTARCQFGTSSMPASNTA